MSDHADARRANLVRAREALAHKRELQARNKREAEKREAERLEHDKRVLADLRGPNGAAREEALLKAKEAQAVKRAIENGEEPPSQMIQRPPEEPGLTLRRASEIPDKPKFDAADGVLSKASSTDVDETPTGVPSRTRDPRRTVQEAQARLQRRSLTMVRRLEEMTELALNDGPKCPTCQRGLPRAEDIRLRATLAVLDRAGLAPQRGQEALSGATGPVLVFPPGSSVSIAVGEPQPIEMGVARRVERTIELRRADEPIPGSGPEVD
jgi:hypothetical protein